MKHIGVLLTLVLIAMFTQASPVNGKNEVIIQNGSTDTHVSIQNSVNGESVSVKIDNNTFTIEGTVTSKDSNSFAVNGQMISIDPSKVSGFSQNEPLEVGKRVKVTGIIQDGKMYAQTITARGTNEATSQVKIETNPSNMSISSPTPLPTPSPTPTINPTPSPTAIPQPSTPSTEEFSEIHNISLIINQITSLMHRVFAVFNGLNR